MKTILSLFFIAGMLLNSETCQGQKATIFGQVFLITHRDTIKLTKARLELFQVTGSKTDTFIDDYYSDGKGRYIISEINYGKYYFKVYYGNTIPFLFFTNSMKTDKCPVFSVDLELKGVPAMYVSNPK
ncbi:MAG: hypothetical protein WCP32_07280 [Bacteroidota bacterium]